MKKNIRFKICKIFIGMTCTDTPLRSCNTIIQYFVASGASLKSWRKYHFPQEKATWCVRVRAHFPWFPFLFFILNYPFDTNFGNPAVESSRTIYQGAFLVFISPFFYGYSRDRPHSIFFYVTLGQKRSNVKVAREINIPSAWGDYARPRVTYKSRRPRWNLGRNGKTVFISRDSLR